MEERTPRKRQPTRRFRPQWSPTSTPEPTPTPTVVPDPTPTPAPTQTEPPAAVAPGQIRPLQLDDPLKVAGELSEAELACAAGVADIGTLLQIFAAPDQADLDELSQLIGCLEDETVLRLFVTEIAGLEEPLSVEASDCVREGMEGVDARSAMLSGMAGDEQSAMMGAMSSFFLILTCLNDEEFAAAAPSLGIPVEEREGMFCLLEELGGPENLIAAFSGEDEEAMMGLFGALVTCGLEEGAPPPDPGPTSPPGPEDTSMMPSDPLATVLPGLSDAELACLSGVGVTPAMLQDPSALDAATPEQQAQVLGCFSDETLTNLFLSGLVGDPSRLSPQTSACIHTGMEGIDLRGVMSAGYAGDEQAAMVGGMSAMFLTVSCLNDEELEAAGPTLGMTPEDREGLQCVMEQMGGPEGMAEAFSAEDESGFIALLGAAFTCDLDIEGLAPGG